MDRLGFLPVILRSSSDMYRDFLPLSVGNESLGRVVR